MLYTPPIIIMLLEFARGRGLFKKTLLGKGWFYIGVLLALYLAGGVYAMPLALPLFMTGWIHNRKALSMIMDGKDNRDEEGAPIRTWLTNRLCGDIYGKQGFQRWGLIYSFLTYPYAPFIPLCYWYASKVEIMSYDIPAWVADLLSRLHMIDPQMRVERTGIAEALAALSVGAVFMLVIMLGWV